MSDFSTREFEISALAFFLQKPQYFAQKRTGIKDIRFDDKKVQNILRQLHTSFEQYQEFPTKHELKEKLKSYLTDKAQYLDLEWQEYEDLVDDVYSREVTGNTGEQVNLKLADQQRTRLVDKLANAKPEDLAIVAKEVEGDLKGFRRLHYQEVDLGLNFFSKGGVAKTVKLIGDYNEGICIPSGFVHLDQAMKGGTRKGELNVVLGSTGLGKTTTLLNFTKGFVRSGARVCHIYLDSLEEEMATRMASCWLGQSIEYGTDLEQIGEMLQVYADEHENKLITVQFPGFSISAHDVDEFLTNLKSYLYQVDKENGVYEDQCGVIDILVLDYMDLLVYDGNVEGFMVDEHKAGELNAVAIKHKIGIWTGTQGGTNAMKSDKPKLHDAHGYKSRFHPVANVLIVCCPEEERFLLSRRFTFDFGKARRPVEFSSIPFIMDVCTQCIYEDPERVPNIKTGKDTPDQNEYQVKGTPAKALPSGAVAGAFV